MTRPDRNAAAVRDRLREIADSIDVGAAGPEDMRALLELADWFDDRHRQATAPHQLPDGVLVDDPPLASEDTA